VQWADNHIPSKYVYHHLQERYHRQDNNQSPLSSCHKLIRIILPSQNYILHKHIINDPDYLSIFIDIIHRNLPKAWLIQQRKPVNNSISKECVEVVEACSQSSNSKFRALILLLLSLKEGLIDFTGVVLVDVLGDLGPFKRGCYALKI